jgi:hypothetical protein
MNINNKFFTKAAILSGLMLGSTAVFAADSFPGVSEQCEQLYLVNDPNNPYKDSDSEGGECIDVPVNLKTAKVLFNLDHPVMTPDGVDPVGLRHMVMLGRVMKHRIETGLINPNEVAIVGIMHGSAMTQAKWPFTNGSPVTDWFEQIFALKNAGVNIQLEVCGVTLKGMQLKMKAAGNPNWAMMDERAIYSSENGRIYVNQGAVGRMIDLQQNKFAYIQED